MTVDELSWDGAGLLPVIVQDAASGAVLTLAYANREALARTLATGATWLWSRSRAELWHKGATSGNVQAVREVRFDCDADALLYRVDPAGPACHTGAPSCFAETLALVPQAIARERAGGGEPVRSPDGEFERAITHLRATIEARRGADPATSYTAKLLHDGVDRIGKKIGEEATEVVIAAKNADPSELVRETADLLYHVLVMLAERGVSLDAVGAELTRRAS